MRSLKSKNSFWGNDQTKSVKVTLAMVLLCSCALIFLCWSVGHSFSAPPVPSEDSLKAGYQTSVANIPDDLSELLRKRLMPAEVTQAEPVEPNVAEVVESPSSIFKTACKLIYQGKFDFAGELLKQTNQGNPGDPNSSTRLGEGSLSRSGTANSTQTNPPDEFNPDQVGTARQLLEIIGEYQTLNQQRLSARQSAYQQQLAELEKLQTEISVSDINDLAYITDSNDTTDTNDITKVLSVIAKASELAAAAQRAEFLSSPFVKQVLQKTIDKAAGFETQGKWLDAYTTCYVWLQAIDPNNKAYSDYADQLLDKAGIVLSLQDSPCETREERFHGIKKEMFIRTIDALDTHYVNTIDYSQMAADALKRCKMLAEVVGTYLRSGQQLPAVVSETKDAESSFSLPDANELANFSSALTTMSSEVESALKPTEDPVYGLTLSMGLSKDKFIEIFERVISINAVTVHLPQQVLTAQFAEAALSSLDPYTVIVWPRQVQDFEKAMTNEFTGIGIEITKTKGQLTVSSLLADTPAYRTGLDAGDVITAVDGLDTKDMSLMCAVHKITGPKGTKVTLTIKRPGEENAKDITITRAKITVSSIRGWQRTETGDWLYMIDHTSTSSAEPQNKIGYVRLTSFSADAPSELDKVLDQLEKEGLKGLILDLRFNSGGLLDSAVGVADIFIKDGLIVRTQPGSNGTLTYKPAHAKGTHPDFPLVILINSNSASASEIVAGALADKVHNRAILVGTRTHGKGSVQGMTSYPGGGAVLKYTMSYYHLPSGQRVKSRDQVEKQGGKDWGVGPNIEVELTNDELRKMLDIQRDNDVLVQSDRGTGRESPKRHTIGETVAADPQLAVALLVIKTKLIQL